ncbi:MAG: hypothetical protein C4527_03970 [Candidatus Omnitrophota bacterium]|jgi:rhamnogalacturonan endolyase|nr:MAG: hypothetical protein C4527_03970 [Candidatus Omnitrophota bacterium]
MRYQLTCVRFILTILSVTIASPFGVSAERLDHGLIALERDDGSVYLGWRWLKEDPSDLKFTIQCKNMDESEWKTISENTDANCSTNFIDPSVEKGKTYTYQLLVNGQISGNTVLHVDGEADSYISVPLQGEYDAKCVGVADLDGDGAYEYIIQQPNFNTDPYQQPGYWKRSPTTYKIEAYKRDGTMMWRYDMGWAIEAGTWYAPFVVYDVDQDGKAEVYAKAGEGDPRSPAGHVESGPEYLVKINGETGEVTAKTPWLSRDGFDDYNYYCRNFLTVAYLDGKTPSLIMQRGTYRLIKMQALDKDFNQLWYWEATGEYEKYRGQSSHGLITADVDDDGRDELVMGAAVIDENGKGLWTLGMGHPDVCYVADIDPDNPGLEIYYGFETRQKTDGMCVVDAKTGRKLWTHKEPTTHLHGQGMVADVLADYAGMETYTGERDTPDRWLYSAKGQLIKLYNGGTLSPRALWWDDDPQKEVAMNGEIRDWDGQTYLKTQGRVLAVVDCLGDAREELLTSLKGELRIYSSAILSNSPRPCLMQDHQYRMGVAAQTMGYYYPAQLGK